MRLPRSRRLDRRSEFQRVRREGRSHAGKHFVLGVLALPEEDDFRIGIITTKRLGNAVTRNRIRRQLRAVVRKEPPAGGHHVVIVARTPAAGAGYGDLLGEWRRVAGRAGLLGDASKEDRA